MVTNVEKEISLINIQKKSTVLYKKIIIIITKKNEWKNVITSTTGRPNIAL